MPTDADDRDDAPEWEDGTEWEDDRDDGSPVRSGASRLGDRLKRGVRGPAAASPGRSAAATRRAIDRLDDRERRFGFIAAAAAVVFGLVLYLTETNNPKFHVAKGQLTPQTTLVLAIGAGVVLALTTLLGRRALVGFVALFTFLAFGGSFIGLPFLVLAGWLLFRSFKVQRAAAQTARASRDGASDRQTTSPRSAAGRSSARAPSRSTVKAKKGPATPTANKRYTPKRPPPPAPKPSRRERKAAGAKE